MDITWSRRHLSFRFVSLQIADETMWNNSYTDVYKMAYKQGWEKAFSLFIVFYLRTESKLPEKHRQAIYYQILRAS